MMDYVYFGEVQSTILQHYERYQTGMAFPQAVSYLRSKNIVHTDPPVLPDFYTWDISNLSMLKNLANQIPIFFDEIDQVAASYSPQNHILTLSEYRHVQISLDSIYAPDHFTILPYVAVLYVIKGTASFSTPSEHYELSTGSLLILSPQLPYRLLCTPDDIVLNILSSKELFQKHFYHLLTQNDLLSNFFHQAFIKNEKDVLHFILTPDSRVLEIIKHLFAEFTSDNILSTEIFLNYLQIFYAQILRNCDTDIKTNTIKYSKVTLLPALLLYIQKNYQTVTLTELSEKFNYAPAYLSRLIKQETGQNLSVIKADFKLSSARKLLLSTSYSIERISELSGYNSADHFTYSFKKKYHESPRNYRKRNQ